MTQLSRCPVPPTRPWAAWSCGHLLGQAARPRAWLPGPGTWSTWRTHPASAGPASTPLARQAACALGKPAAAACAAGGATTPRAAWWPSPATARCSGAATWSASSACRRSSCTPVSTRSVAQCASWALPGPPSVPSTLRPPSCSAGPSGQVHLHACSHRCTCQSTHTPLSIGPGCLPLPRLSE